MKSIIIAVLSIFLFTACATWDGVKSDSSKAWEATKDTTSKAYKGTKKAIHDATAE